MTTRNVLYLSYDGMTDPLGQSQVIPYLAGLSGEGYRFVLVSFEKKSRFRSRKQSISNELTKYNIHWIPLLYHKNPPVISTLLDIYLLKKKAVKLHQEHRFEIVHCRSYITSLVGLSLKRRFGIKFIFDMRGFWADERIEGELWPSENILYRKVYQYFKKKEIDFLSEADYTISLTEAAKREIHTWQKVARNPIPIEVIPCCADLQLFNPANISESLLVDLRESLGISLDSFVLLYVGSIGTWYMLEEMLDFFKALVEKKPSALFLIVTKDDPEVIQIISRKKKINQSQLIITSAERHMMPTYIMLAQLAVFFIKPIFSKKASSPTKQGEIMGMGVPIICNNHIGDTARIILEADAGLIVDNFEQKTYKEVIAKLERVTKLNAEAIREGAKEYYSLDKGILKYETVYTKVLN